jgi:peptide/nickel transport system permease protein
MSNVINYSSSVIVEEKKEQMLLVDLLKRLLKEKPLGTIGGIIVLVLFLTGIFAEFIAPYGYKEVNLMHTLEAPSTQFFLGTDNMGRDMLSRIIFGARISMFVGLGGAGLSVAVGTLVGGVSGFFGGKFDMVVQRFVDAFMCFPPLFFLLTVMAILGPGLIQVILVLGIQGGIRQSRVIRSAVIGIKENMYFEAAKAIGSSPLRILIHHVLPNIMAPIIILFSVSMGSMILMEATLSFLGFGIPPPVPSWGGMLSGSARTYMYIAPWMAIWPGLALSIAIYGINMLGDAIRDLLDPRLRGGVGRYGKSKKKAKLMQKIKEEK